MTTTRTPKFRAGLEYIALPSLLALAMSAQAQEKPKASVAAEDEIQEVVVTGSRIARPELDRLEPTVTLDSKALDQRGYFDVGQALSELPGFGVQPVSANNTQSSFGVAQSFVDLYSLGSQRTLVLVNGRRFVSGNTPSLNGPASPGEQVDLNTIPTKLIDHIETVSVGGAPIYGADAIAGTVNIILKKDFQGLDIDGQAGVSNQKDAWNYRARVLAGQNFADGRGNITVNGEFSKSDGLTGSARPVYAQDLGFLAPATPGPYKTVLTPANSVPQVNFGGIPLVDDGFLAPAYFGPDSNLGITNGAGQLLAWGNTGQLGPYDVGTPTGNPIFNSGGDGLRLSTVSNLLSPTERVNFDTLLNFDVTDHIKAFGEGWFSETHSTNLLSQPAYNTALFGSAGTANGNFVMSINNPYLSANDRTLIQNALLAYGAAKPFASPGGNYLDPNWNPNQFYVSRASIDLQNGRSTFTQVLARGVGGLQGDFSFLNRNFNWDASINYGSVDSNSVVPSYVFQNLQNALNAVVGPTGQIVCGGTPVNAPTSTLSPICAPLNIFGNGSPSVAAKEYITHLAQAETLNSQRDAVLNFGGDILKLPAGEWKASVGYENRRESGKFLPDTFYTQQLGQASVAGVEGSYLNNEVYGETLIPVFSPQQDIPGLYRVEIEGAGRHVNNSLSGGATIYTEGLKWAPTQDVMFRINKTKSIRAPAITELFLPTATSFQFANDPCDANYIGQGNVPATRAKNCAAAGIPLGFVSNVVNATAQGTTAGNPNLAPETANSKTFGFVFTPRWVPKLNLTVDYINIRLKDAISSLTLVDILDACYDSANYPNEPVCKSFTRNASGQITNFNAGYINAGLLEFSGITGEADYTIDFPGQFGALNTRVGWLDMQQLNQKIGSASQVSEAGTLGANAGLQATPKHKGNINLDYQVWKLDWNVQGIFIGAAKFSNADSPGDKDITGVSRWWLFNSTVSYAPIDHLNVRLIVDNVFNKEPPYPAIAGTGGNFESATSLYFSGILGRTYQLGVDYKF
jgi:iron complex outermembrane recepter protein